MMDLISNSDLLRLAQEARGEDSEIPWARSLLHKELGKRGLLTASDNDATGFVDALEDTDGMIEPSHTDQHWQVDFDRETNYIRGSD